VEHPELELQLVVAASALLDRYGAVVDRIEADGFAISERVLMVLDGESPLAMAKTTGVGIIELAGVFDRLRPDAVVTIADRYETLATATAAAYLGVPLVHVQGGEVTGSIDERVRHAVTKLADLHLPATERARERIIRMGEDPRCVVATGCPSIDLALRVRNGQVPPFDPYERYQGVGGRPDLSAGYLVVMQHPVTNEHDDAREQVRAAAVRLQYAMDALNKMLAKVNDDMIVDVHGKEAETVKSNLKLVKEAELSLQAITDVEVKTRPF
jgi:UDP-hydrolysing UDP-N-acetyl-D-glucosamine 2-epimerase